MMQYLYLALTDEHWKLAGIYTPKERRAIPDRIASVLSSQAGVLEAGQKRISGLPDFYSGPAICLIGQRSDVGSEHGMAHAADAAVASLGSGQNAPQGTADIHTITLISVNSANIATGGVCAAEIARAVAAKPALMTNILGRTTIQPPTPGSDAYSSLSSGIRTTLH